MLCFPIHVACTLLILLKKQETMDLLYYKGYENKFEIDKISINANKLKKLYSTIMKGPIIKFCFCLFPVIKLSR